jgi:nitronate monooxygenase
VLSNPAVEALMERERSLGADIQFADIAEFVAGVYPKVMREGRMDAGAWCCGMAAGLIRDIPSVAELIERIMHEAQALVRGRLAR